MIEQADLLFVNGVVVTMDADFHTLMALSQAKAPSVIRIREEGLKAAAQAELIRSVISRCGSELDSGVLLTVRKDRVRVHALPVL